MGNYQSTHTGAEHDAYTTKQDLINLIYPVGAIYISVNSTNPNTLFGGTWEQIQDKFLLCAGTTYTAGTSGGEASHNHTTVASTTGGTAITINQMPSHTHDTYGTYPRINDDSVSGTKYGHTTATAWWFQATASTVKATGGGQAHTHSIPSINTSSISNMPPYLTVYVWKRTA